MLCPIQHSTSSLTFPSTPQLPNAQRKLQSFRDLSRGGAFSFGERMLPPLPGAPSPLLNPALKTAPAPEVTKEPQTTALLGIEPLPPVPATVDLIKGRSVRLHSFSFSPS